MTPYTEPMDLGEIYGNTFAITRRTLAGVGGIALLMLIVGGLCYTYGQFLYVSKMLDAFAPYAGVDIKSDQKAAQAIGTAVLPALVPMLGSLLAFIALSIAAQTTLTAGGWEALTGEDRGLVRRSLGRPLVVAFLQTIILGAIMVLIYALLLVVSFPFGESSKIIMMVGSMLAFLLIIAYTIVRIQNVVVEDRGPWRGLIASITRVKGNLPRVLGLLFMFGLVYAVGVLLINQLTSGDPLGALRMAGQGNAGGGDVDMTISALTAQKALMTWPYMIANTIWNSVTFVVLFNMSTVIYADLRARRGEFHPEGAEDEEGWASPN